MAADRLVELFLQSTRDGTGGPMQEPDEAGIDKAMAHLEQMLTSDEAAQVSTPAATFVGLAMALEEKPKLGLAALRCYQKAWEYTGKGSSKNEVWERCVLLQQLGAVSLRNGRLREADAYLEECAELCAEAEGHPREANLFQRAFSTQQTRLEFAVMVQKLHAKTCAELKDHPRAHLHVAEAKRLQQALDGDAVERAEALKTKAEVKTDEVKQLWAEEAEEVRLKEYRFLDEGPTVLVMLDLNDHLQMGEDASALVSSLRQFRVNCKERSLDIQLRLRKAGRVVALRLLLEPLCQEVIPEDTVPRLRGKESKRRLEVKLFKREKDRKWFGDLVAEVYKEKSEKTKCKSSAAKGTLLNPLTPEEIARLPKPGTSTGDNRPSSFKETAGYAETTEPLAPDENRPTWVADILREAENDQLLLKIQLSEALSVGMEDLDLAVDDCGATLRLRQAPEAALRLPLAAPELQSARWRKKSRTLELRLALAA